MTIDEMIARKKELGYSNEQLSKLSGVPLGTVQKIFGRITSSPRRDTILALEKVLKEESFSYQTPESASFVEEAAPEYKVAVKQKYTLKDYYALPDDQRKELIDGELYDMASPGIAHQLLLFRLWEQFDQCIKEHSKKCLVVGAPFDVQLDKDEYTMVEPDIMIICNVENLLNSHYYGAPDFVAEILSPSTRSRDMLLKLQKYYDAGVREYWIVDSKNRCVIVYNLAEDQFSLEKYSFDDQIPLLISEGKCVVDFSVIHKEIERYLD